MDIKNKELEIDKKLEGLISGAKKDILSITSNDRKLLNQDIVKLGEEVRKTKTETEAKLKLNNDGNIKTHSEQQIKLEELAKKIDNLKLEVDKRMAELKGISLESSKAQ